MSSQRLTISTSVLLVLRYVSSVLDSALTRCAQFRAYGRWSDGSDEFTIKAGLSLVVDDITCIDGIGGGQDTSNHSEYL